MDEIIGELVSADVIYLRESVQRLELLKKKYPGNPELAKTVDKLVDVRKTGLKDMITSYRSLELSHLCSVKSVELVSPEEAKRALAILKGSTR
jgi:hypothetical protein